MGKPKIKIHDAEMSHELQQDALQFASLAFNLYEDDWDIAQYITKEFEKRQGGDWNCIVGDCGYYAPYVTYNQNFLYHFSIDDKQFTVFKSA